MLDIGAGDAKGSLRFARENPDTAVIAVDSSYDALEKSSKIASKKPARGGATNLLCLYADAKDLSEIFSNQINEVRIYLPWGSLLESIADIDPSLFETINDICVDDASFNIVINAEIWRNNLPQKFEHIREITPDFFENRRQELKELGFELVDSRLLDIEEIKKLDTTWTAKLMSSREIADFVMAKGVVKKTSS